ncbi:hypothetical protein [Arthrobacter sedimenti]|uniref:hypothetical protein n=1 Tax=Arthrobacter sedimenti TaxID=2694931 RepID=UPI000B35C8C2|nr:hypothetical protein [Arthrobacter sedimenti]OUM41705.1 hypothetical protein B8W73_08595 [Arthrobacter agilis]
MTTAQLVGLSPDEVHRKSLISGTVGAIIEWYGYAVSMISAWAMRSTRVGPFPLTSCSAV